MSKPLDLLDHNLILHLRGICRIHAYHEIGGVLALSMMNKLEWKIGSGLREQIQRNLVEQIVDGIRGYHE